MKPIRILVLSLLAISLGLSACSRREPAAVGPDAPADAVPDIVGEYIVNGLDPDGFEYSGLLNIQVGDEPGEYMLEWVVTGSSQEGTGVLAGNQLTVTWRGIKGLSSGSSGSGVYTVTVNGELYGVRSVDGVESQATETAYPND